MTNEEFTKLCWTLLEAKVKYYVYPSMDNIPDSEYDRLEKLYTAYVEENGLPNTIQSMVGVDKTRPSIQLVIAKLLRNYDI
jgi:hypothetical protein